MTCYDDLFVTERYAREVVDGLRLVCKRERQACQRHLDDLERQGTDSFPYVLMKAGQTGFLTGLKNTACTCVAYIPGSISSCCLFSISTWAVFLAGYIEKQAHGGLPKLLISALVAMSKALKCQALLYTACVLTLSIHRVSLSCGDLKWHRRLNARPWTGNRQDVFGVMPVLWVKLL